MHGVVKECQYRVSDPLIYFVPATQRWCCQNRSLLPLFIYNLVITIFLAYDEYIIKLLIILLSLVCWIFLTFLWVPDRIEFWKLQASTKHWSNNISTIQSCASILCNVRVADYHSPQNSLTFPWFFPDSLQFFIYPLKDKKKIYSLL